MDQPQSESVAPDSRTSRSDNQSGSTSDAPLDRPTFTFIDHDDDLTSKRIKDANARKAIRSHVMRDVRRRERLAGLKRTARRDSSNQGAPAKSRTGKDSSPTEKTLVLRSASPSSSSLTSSSVEVQSKRRGSSTTRRDRSTKRAASHADSLQTTSGPRALPSSWSIAPFCTTPGTSKLTYKVAYLVHHFTSVLVPTSFPTAAMAKRALIRSSFSDSGSFYGLMCMSAAHRAVLSSAHLGGMDVARSNFIANDPDYCSMRAKCIHEMNLKISDPKKALTDEAFDTIINLLNGALIGGFYDESRIHLMGMKRMVDLRGGITHEKMRATSMWAAIVVTDVKAASEVQRRIQPLISSITHQTGSGFFSNLALSLPLIRILYMVRDLVFYNLAAHINLGALMPSDHQFFSSLNHSVEHQLLAYIYPDDPENPNPHSQPIDLHPIEALTRVATITFLNKFLIIAPPSCGLGRALTRHCVNAVNDCPFSLLHTMPKGNYGLFAWALFTASQNLTGYPERQWFVQRLARVAKICDWHHWDQVSRIMSDYFYVGHLHGEEWRTIWDEVAAEVVVPDEDT
ncbi:hypothetical protein POX_b02169 [Penicillium oxalicum]|uniref:hypothetical protein n=1 Tax=Penicillium oxalicum TaxID=69781 RepID=UPI0020B67A20|nr:hypothetical protein POX_b02169 [Penicillium oxalicum]KAI2792133.1 hypothetical protein POX_b02169 [Penicillium oxalicum]